MIIVDTGSVVAMANRKDADHERCTDLLVTTPGPLLPEPLIVEIGYVPASRAGSRVEADFLRDAADGAYDVTSLAPATLNHRDFSVVRPRHVATFALLPS